LVYRWAYDYGVPGAELDYIPQNVPPSRVEKGEGIDDSN
jgi:cytochrome c oxidase subunit 1